MKNRNHLSEFSSLVLDIWQKNELLQLTEQECSNILLRVESQFNRGPQLLQLIINLFFSFIYNEAMARAYMIESSERSLYQKLVIKLFGPILAYLYCLVALAVEGAEVPRAV